MKKHLILDLVVIAGATVAIAGCTSSSSPSPGPVTSTVTSTASQNPVAIQNYAFSPSTLTIQKGANVTWKNDDSVQHNVVSDSSAFSSPLLNTGDTYTYQFSKSGSFSYHCAPHLFVKGTIVSRDGPQVSGRFSGTYSSVSTLMAIAI